MEKILKGTICICILSMAMAQFDFGDRKFTLEEFDQQIGQPCLNRMYDPNNPNQGGNLPLGRTMESFISMVETIEKNHTTWRIFQVAKTIIKRFGFDGIIFDLLSGKRQPIEDKHYTIRRKIIDALIPQLQTSERFREEDLTEREKCAMFFMVGHLVNDTILPGDVSAIYNDHHSDGTRTVTKNPREQGVVGLYGDERNAIALGKVLLGIIASENTNSFRVGDVVSDDNSHHKLDKDRKIDPLVGVTLGDVVAHAVIDKRDSSSNSYGRGGSWKSTVCSIEYNLDDTSPAITLAVLRGAIDGLLIGSTLRGMQNRESLTLSKVLRMYYDPRGLIGDNNANPVTYCRRSEYNGVGNIEGDVVSSIQGFYHAYFAQHQSGSRYDDEGDAKASEGYSNIQSIMHNIEINDGRCIRQAQQDEKCETSSNVFVVLDTDERETEAFRIQESTISKLATRLDIGSRMGTIGVYTNNRDGHLQVVIENSTNAAAPACEVSYNDRAKNPSSADEEALMRSLNQTLQDFEQKTEEQSYANSKAVIIFKNGPLKSTDQNKLTWASNAVRVGHKDTKVFAVGNDQAPLQFLATEAGDVITGIFDSTQLADKLAEKICKVPSIFQYKECWNHRNRREEESRHVNYVTPDHTQYWAMYPEYFHKTYNGQLKFLVEGGNGDIKVCHSRYEINPRELGDRNTNVYCQETKPEAKELVFHLSNPCHKYHVDSCPPAYFSITGKPSTSAANRARCYEPGCKRVDQIKFVFSHQGISCNSCTQLLSSQLTIFALVAAVIYKLLIKSN